MSEGGAVQDSGDGIGQMTRLAQEPLLEDPVDVGQQLRTAREVRGISIKEAAEKLRLSVHQVEEMEENDWSHLPGTIFRGFVRNYARYLEIEAEPLMKALGHVKMSPGPELSIVGAFPSDMPREGKRDRRDYIRVIAGLIILALALLACFFVPTETWQSMLDAGKSVVSENKVVPKPVMTDSTRERIEIPVTAVQLPTPVGLDTAIPDPDALPPSPVEMSTTQLLPAVDSGGGMLAFSFTGSSWVEVRDRNDQVLFSRICLPGSQHEVTGLPPFSLVIGNASQVTLQYKGDPVDLAQRSSRDDVARLVLE